MAAASDIEFISVPQQPLAVYDKSNYFNVKSTNENAIGIRLIVTDVDDVKLIETYSPIFNGSAIFNTSNTLSSILYKYDNILDRNGNDVEINNDINQEQRVTLTFTTILSNGVVGGSSSIIYYIIKSTDNLLDDQWSISGTYKGTFLNYNNKTKYAFADQIIPVSFISRLPESFVLENDSTTLITVPAGRYINNLTIDASAYTDMLKINANTINNPFTVYLDNKTYKRKKTIYFMNRYGGWEWANFIDYEVEEKTNKNSYNFYTGRLNDFQNKTIINNSYEEYTLYGRILSDENLEYLFDLVSSPIVLDEDNNMITLTSDSFTLDNELGEYSLQYNTKNRDIIRY